MQVGPAQAAGAGKGEQPLAPDHQRTRVGRAGQQALPVAQRQDEIPRRPLVGLGARRGPQQQVTRGVEIVRVGCFGIRPGIAVAVIAEPADRHRHVRPGRIIGRQPVEQRGVHGDGLIAVGPDRRDRGQVPLAGPPRRRQRQGQRQPMLEQGQPMLEQGPEQCARLGDHRQVADPGAPVTRPVTGVAAPGAPVAGGRARVGGPVAAGRNSEQGGQRRACVLDRRIQAWPVKYRAISDVCHPDPLCGLAR
jgi:hypothetical protein